MRGREGLNFASIAVSQVKEERLSGPILEGNDGLNNQSSEVLTGIGRFAWHAGTMAADVCCHYRLVFLKTSRRWKACELFVAVG